MTSTKLLAFAGSARTNSCNKKLAKAASVIAGKSVNFIDLADYPAPVYNGDDEIANGLPQTMQQVKTLMQQHDGFIIATPEYNGHVPPLLCNVFSWISRKEGDEKSMVAFDGKYAAIMAASPGRLGGVRVIPRLRDTLAELGVTVVPGFVTVPSAYAAFDENGTPVDDQVTNNIQVLVTNLINACH